MVLPIAYMAPKAWYKAYLTAPEEVEIEGLESFEKQTCRNRCLIESKVESQKSKASRIMLSVPVKKVEHKQLTKDIEISYQSRWQHQHWISLVSTYRHTPYFDYYEEFFKPFYEKEYRFLWDYNSEIHQTIVQLLLNSPKRIAGFAYRPTNDWRGEELNRYFGDGKSILDVLFEYGPETTDHLK
ncbi:MAG: WbqC family protein [Paludibacteraceae bacterium]|nr:WbqC family protein [Paludibacteraceae bacterium]